MIRSSLLVLALFSAPFAASRSVAAFSPGISASVARAPAAAEEDTVLQGVMKTFKTGQRSLKKLIKDPAANEQALLEVLASMEAGALIAIGEEPPPPEGLAGVDLELFRVGFKGQIATLLQQILALQAAALRQDGAALQVAYDALSSAKKAGHQTYRDFD